MVVCIEEIFSFSQTVLRKMGLPEIKLHHPSQGMTYHDFQRIYGLEGHGQKSFEREVISCIADVLGVYGQGLAKDIFVEYIEDSERIDSIEFENSDFVAFKRELPKFLYLTYASFYSQKSQSEPKKMRIKKGCIFDIERHNNEVVFVLKNTISDHHFEIETENHVQLIQLLQGIGIHIPPLRAFVYLEDEFTQQLLYGREVCICEYENTLGQMVFFLKFFPTEEQAQLGFQKEFQLKEKGFLKDCALKKESREFFNSLLSEDITTHKKRTMGGTLEVYTYEHIATVAFSTNQNKIGQIYGWFDDRGMHWKSDVCDKEIIPEMSRVLRNMDAEIGCQPQKPSRRTRRRR